MSLPTKVCILGGVGCIASAAIGLSQARSSLSIREKLSLEGYVLISSKDKVAESIWKDRAKLYKKEPHNLLLKGLFHEEVLDDGNKLKEECAKYTEIDVPTNSIGEDYDKITKLCTLNIKEYVELYLNKDEEEKIIEKAEEDAWKEIFNKQKTEITKIIAEITEDNAKDKLSKFCEEIYPLQKSNSNREKEYQVNQWCVKRKEKPKATEKKPSQDVRDSASGDDSDSD